MALDGLDRLRERGHFVMPETSLDSIRHDEWDEDGGLDEIDFDEERNPGPSDIDAGTC